jgi:DNA-directed RNA polymerase subunit RPC12/RpoP
MNQKFHHECEQCGTEHETFHAYTAYVCPECV